MKQIPRVSIFAVIALTGCASADKITLPNNQHGFSIECEKAANCYNKAQKICPSGYEIIDKSNASEGGMVNGIGVVASKLTLIIRCK